MRVVWLRLLLLVCPLMGDYAVEGALVVPWSDSRFSFVGMWHATTGHVETVYAGSQWQFILSGQARLLMDSGDKVWVKVRMNGTTVWQGVPERGIDVGRGNITNSISVCCTAVGAQGFDTSNPGSARARWRVSGLELDEGSLLLADPSNMAAGMTLDVIGDSVTAGISIYGRSGNGLTNSDVSLSYAFLLAEHLHMVPRIRGYPGASTRVLSGRIPYYQENIPLPVARDVGLVIVNVGANDRQISNLSYLQDMKRLMDAVSNTYPGARVVLLNFFRMTPDRWPVLQTVAKSYPGQAVDCFDARPYLVGYGDEGVHPDVESHQRLASALAAYLEPWLAEKRRGNK